MHLNLVHASDESSKGGSFICIEHYKPPSFNDEDSQVQEITPKIFMKFKCLHYSDESMTHFIVKKGEKWDECFIIIPFIENPDESLVYYYSGFATNSNHVKEFHQNHKCLDYLQEKRFDFLSDLKQYCSKQSRIINKSNES